MPKDFRRRDMIGLSVAATTVALGVGALNAQPVLAATQGSDEGNPPIVPVPGMIGDPRDNEFWYVYDEVFYFKPEPYLAEMFARFTARVGTVRSWRTIWLQHRQGGNYRQSWTELWAPLRDDLQVLSTKQIEIFQDYYGCNLPRLVPSFERMAEGVLWDPRRADGVKLHTMDPPEGGTEAYHRWHAIIRAMVFLRVDAVWWEAIDRLVGYAWAVQSLAKPVRDAKDNPGLPYHVKAELRRRWLPRSSERLEKAFEAFPAPAEPAP